jgi:hypothetical protein
MKRRLVLSPTGAFDCQARSASGGRTLGHNSLQVTP